METTLTSVDETIGPDTATSIDTARAPEIVSPIALDDIAPGVFATFGGLGATLGKVKGLPPQTVTIDRRDAGTTLNTIFLAFSKHVP
jgi:hypothetical protein